MARRRQTETVDVVSLYPTPPVALVRNVVSDWVEPGEVGPPDDCDPTTDPRTALLQWVQFEAFLRRRRAVSRWLADHRVPDEDRGEVLPFRGIPRIGGRAGEYLTAAGFTRRETETDAGKWRHPVRTR